jgi:opacity protein-like surface antigen
MKYYITVIAFLVLLSTSSVYSQNPMRVGGELGIQLPMGDFGDGANTGFGLSGIFQYQLQPQIIVGGTLGYQSWGGQAEGFSWSNIPIMGLINYQFNTEGLIPFVGAELGLNMLSASYDIFGFSGSSSSTEFGINILGGVEQRLNENLSWRVNAKYNMILASGSNITYLGINAGVMYHLK